jgi:long-chain acyl-CoA synthetase
MVYGDRHPHLVALLVPDPDWLQAWARARGKTGDAKTLADDPDLASTLSIVVERVNAGLSSIEKIRRFLVAGEMFTIDNGMLTPTLKIRRHKVREVYGARLEALYS